jgi:uncharacterized membrane protein YeaQ/YmgE (transglycosylase-associated protein family)
MIGFIAWIVFGLIAGVIAKLIMPGRDPGGMVMTILLGIAGAVIAGFIGQLLGWYRPGDAAGLIAAILGSVLLLFVYRRIATRA